MREIKSDFKELFAILSNAGFDVELTQDKEHFSIKVASISDKNYRKIMFFFEENGNLWQIEDWGSV